MSQSGVISNPNSSTNPLIANGEFIGTAEIVAQYAGLYYAIECSTNATLSLEFSQDGGNWSQVEVLNVSANVIKEGLITLKNKYFRSRVVNLEDAAQTFLRLSIIYKQVIPSSLTIDTSGLATSANQEILNDCITDNKLNVNAVVDTSLLATEITSQQSLSNVFALRDFVETSFTFSPSKNLWVQVDTSETPIDVSGSVSISNLPATQPISGSVSVSNFPATQPVSIASLPSVEVNNFATSGLAKEITLGNLYTTTSGMATTTTTIGNNTGKLADCVNNGIYNLGVKIRESSALLQVSNVGFDNLSNLNIPVSHINSNIVLGNSNLSILSGAVADNKFQCSLSDNQKVVINGGSVGISGGSVGITGLVEVSNIALSNIDIPMSYINSNIVLGNSNLSILSGAVADNKFQCSLSDNQKVVINGGSVGISGGSVGISGLVEVSNIALSNIDIPMSYINSNVNGLSSCVSGSNLNVHMFGSSDGTAWHHIKTNPTGVVSTNSTVQSSGTDITSHSISPYTGLDTYLINSSIASTQSGNWSIRVQDGSGNLITSTTEGQNKRGLDVNVDNTVNVANSYLNNLDITLSSLNSNVYPLTLACATNGSYINTKTAVYTNYTSTTVSPGTTLNNSRTTPVYIGNLRGSICISGTFSGSSTQGGTTLWVEGGNNPDTSDFFPISTLYPINASTVAIPPTIFANPLTSYICLRCAGNANSIYAVCYNAS